MAAPSSLPSCYPGIGWEWGVWGKMHPLSDLDLR